MRYLIILKDYILIPLMVFMILYTKIALAQTSSGRIAQTPNPPQLISPQVPQSLPAPINGAGIVSCTQAIQLLASAKASIQLEQWLHGYVAAYNIYHPEEKRVRLIEPTQMLAFTLQYCRNNPNNLYVSAASALIQSLGGIALETKQ